MLNLYKFRSIHSNMYVRCITHRKLKWNIKINKRRGSHCQRTLDFSYLSNLSRIVPTIWTMNLVINVTRTFPKYFPSMMVVVVVTLFHTIGPVGYTRELFWLEPTYVCIFDAEMDFYNGKGYLGNYPLRIVDLRISVIEGFVDFRSWFDADVIVIV